jgi:hypothetical protein
MAVGVIDATFARAGLDQTMPRITLGSLAPKARALVEQRSLIPGLAKVAARVGLVHALSAIYPRGERALGPWSRGMARVLAV